MHLAGAIILITGSSHGIGADIARALHALGSRVILHGRDGGAALSAELGVPGVAADLAEPGAAVELYQQANQLHGYLDVIVHCAGLGHFGAVAEMDPAEISRMLALNLQAPIELTRAALPDMISVATGHIAFVASIAGLIGVADESVYSASKSGLVGFADGLRLEVARHGVGVSVICPGAVETDFFRVRGAPYTRRFPRPVKPAHVAQQVVNSIEHNRARKVMPRWLALAPAVKAIAPTAYESLAHRFG